MTITVVLFASAGFLGAAAVLDLLAGWRPTLRRGGRRQARELGARTVAGPAPRSPLVLSMVAAGRRVGVVARIDGVQARLVAAGRPLGLSAADFGALSVGACLLVTILAGVWSTVLPGRLGVAVLIVAPVAGAALPGLVVRRLIAQRRRVMHREIADVLDLLAVQVRAGVAVDQVLGDVGRRRGGLVGTELARTARAIGLGVARPQAYAALAVACPIETVAQAVAVLLRAERYGVPPDDALRALAAQARASYVRTLRDTGAKAAPQIQLVVALVLVPAVMLLVAASLVHGMT